MQENNDRFASLWLAETIRRIEQSGTIDDTRVMAKMADGSARADMTDEALICRRAELLARDNPVVQSLPGHIAHMYALGKAAMSILAILAVVAGFSLASSVLLQGSTLNVFLILLILLAPHLLGLMWAVALYGLNAASSWLADAWLWLTARLGRHRDAALLIESLRSLLGRSANFPLMLFGISHLWWVVFALSTMATMYLVFSFAQYTFTWGTTIQQPEFFLKMITAVGWLPGLVGIALPDSSDIASLTDTAATRKTWAVFILGCLAVYAFVPRLLMLAASWYVARSALRTAALATTDAYYINLLNRIRTALAKRSEVIDAAPRHVGATGTPPTAVTRGMPIPGTMAILPFELRDMPSLGRWQAEPGRHVTGNVTDERSRQTALDDIVARNFARAVLVFDARNTADRDAFQFLREVQSVCASVQIVLLHKGSTNTGKLDNWLEGLKELGIDSVLDEIPAITPVATGIS